jgi:hypothetical protein
MNIQNVTIGGREFPVPPLAIKDLRVIVPNVVHLQKSALNGTALLGGDDFGLLIDTVFSGVAAGSPGFKREDFDALPATPRELIAALTVVAEQTGMSAEPGEQRAGEDQATT